MISNLRALSPPAGVARGPLSTQWQEKHRCERQPPSLQLVKLRTKESAGGKIIMIIIKITLKLKKKVLEGSAESHLFSRAGRYPRFPTLILFLKGEKWGVEASVQRGQAAQAGLGQGLRQDMGPGDGASEGSGWQGEGKGGQEPLQPRSSGQRGPPLQNWHCGSGSDPCPSSCA